MKIFGSWSELLSIVWRKNSQNITLRPNQSTTYTAARDTQLPPGDADHIIVSATSTQTLTNKSIDADTNTITNIDNNDIKAAAGIDASKIANGTVSNAEFQALDGVTGTIATTTGTQTLSNKQLVDNTTQFVDAVDSTIQVEIASNGVAATKTIITAVQTANRTVTLPDTTDTLVGKNTTDILTNKTIDGDNNTVQDLPETAIKTNIANASKFFTRNASGVPESATKAVPSGAVVGTTDTQTLSAKTLASPIVTGDLLLQNPSGAQPTLQLSEDPDNGTNKVAIQAPATLAADYTLTLPVDDGTNGQVLSTDGSGVLSWAAAATVSNNLYSAKVASYTILDNDNIRTVGMTTSTTDRTVTLPAAANNTNRIITVVKLDNSTIVVTTLMGVLSITDGTTTWFCPGLNDAITFQSDGTNWRILNDNRKAFEYYVGNTYRGVTITVAGPNITSTNKAGIRLSKTSNGFYRAAGVISYNVTAGTRTSSTFSFTSLAVNGVGYAQSMSATAGVGPLSLTGAYADVTNNNFLITHTSGSTTFYLATFDVQILANPTWSYLD